MRGEFEFTAELWEWDAKGGWYFVTLPHDVTDEIEDLIERSASGTPAGFGSVR